MNPVNSKMKKIVWSLLTFFIVALIEFIFNTTNSSIFYGALMRKITIIPSLISLLVFFTLTACIKTQQNRTSTTETANEKSESPFVAQVVGLQWLNPLQRRDYSTEWQLLWTLSLAEPNKNDDMVKIKPEKYSKLQAVASIATNINGRETFEGYHKKYLDELIEPLYDIYFSSSTYFYNAHSLENKKSWRELAGIHVEYAIPEGQLSPTKAADETREVIRSTFYIGNVNFPTTWSRSTPPDVHITTGGPNAGFTSLSAALDYLQAHPDQTVWVMNWDAPSRPKTEQINENIVLLVLAGAKYKTDRAALAWIGYPAKSNVADFHPEKDLQPPSVQAWKSTIEAATRNVGKSTSDIGYLIHDANNTHPDSSDRIGSLAQTVTMELPSLDFMKQTFNTPALLGEMGAGTALTNVALAIAYANHMGKNVLVAGTSDAQHPTAVLVAPPAIVRPIDPEKPWFRARGENNAYLMWWGIRNDVEDNWPGYSK